MMNSKRRNSKTHWSIWRLNLTERKNYIYTELYCMKPLSISTVFFFTRFNKTCLASEENWFSDHLNYSNLTFLDLGVFSKLKLLRGLSPTNITFLQNACAKNPCSQHGKCKIEPKDNTYYCKCDHGFVGKYCDEGISK